MMRQEKRREGKRRTEQSIANKVEKRSEEKGIEAGRTEEAKVRKEK